MAGRGFLGGFPGGRRGGLGLVLGIGGHRSGLLLKGLGGLFDGGNLGGVFRAGQEGGNGHGQDQEGN